MTLFFASRNSPLLQNFFPAPVGKIKLNLKYFTSSLFSTFIHCLNPDSRIRLLWPGTKASGNGAALGPGSPGHLFIIENVDPAENSILVLMISVLRSYTRRSPQTAIGRRFYPAGHNPIVANQKLRFGDLLHKDG